MDRQWIGKSLKFFAVGSPLEDLETPYDPIMYKINFFNNIEDEAYKITIELLSKDDNKIYKYCLNEIRKKFKEVEDLRARLNRPKRSNWAKTRNNTNNYSNQLIAIRNK